MSRPMKFDPLEARNFYFAMSRQLRRTPSVREFADCLGVSTRTAWRYMRAERSRVKCQHCMGTGYVPSRRSK